MTNVVRSRVAPPAKLATMRIVARRRPVYVPVRATTVIVAASMMDIAGRRRTPIITTCIMATVTTVAVTTPGAVAKTPAQTVAARIAVVDRTATAGAARRTSDITARAVITSVTTAAVDMALGITARRPARIIPVVTNSDTTNSDTAVRRATARRATARRITSAITASAITGPRTSVITARADITSGIEAAVPIVIADTTAATVARVAIVTTVLSITVLRTMARHITASAITVQNVTARRIISVTTARTISAIMLRRTSRTAASVDITGIGTTIIVADPIVRAAPSAKKRNAIATSITAHRRTSASPVIKAKTKRTTGAMTRRAISAATIDAHP